MKRLIKKVVSADGQVWAKVYRDSEWGEYRVASSLGDKYFTSDKDDALDTAKAICSPVPLAYSRENEDAIIQEAVGMLRQGKQVLVELDGETLTLDPTFLAKVEEAKNDPYVDLGFWLGEFLR